MSDRLKELQRQRAIALEQLAWLDREIATQSGQAAPPTSPPAWPAPAAPLPSAAAHPEAAAEEIMSKYQNDPASVQSKVKRGCLLYFFLAFVVVGLGVLALYYHTFRK